MASLFSACKTVVRNQASGTLNIGGYDIGLELYHQSDINTDVQYGDVAFGDDDESKIVVVADDTITVPEGYTLTPDSPKKSLVIMCNNLVNNGTISMYQKAPNVLPHDYFILESNIAGTARDIVIPAYADNAITDPFDSANVSPTAENKAKKNGTNGTNRQCGSGGLGVSTYWSAYTCPCYGASSGSGYVFGGGAGSGAGISNTTGEFTEACSVDSTYPMRGGNGNQSAYGSNTWNILGGVGNPIGETNNAKTVVNNFGCGGRIIVFCINFTNNGTITVNGTDTFQNPSSNQILPGGASGAGAVDIFYTNLGEQGIVTATGGLFSWSKGQQDTYMRNYAGSGGNGSITLTQWTQSKVVKEAVKYFSRSNVDYLLTQMAERIKESRMGE